MWAQALRERLSANSVKLLTGRLEAWLQQVGPVGARLIYALE